MASIRKVQIPIRAALISMGLSGILGFSSLVFAQTYVPGEVLVKIKGKASIQNVGPIAKLRVASKLAEAEGMMAGNLHHLALKSGHDMAQVLSELREDPNVEYAEPNYYLGKLSVDQDKDSERMSAGELQLLVNAAGSESAFLTTGASIEVEQAWSQVTQPFNGAELIVAVIDTGVDIHHEVFAHSGAIWTNPREIPGNGVDDDRNGYVDDVNGWNFHANTNNPYDDDGHGTHVAGIILGVTQDIFADNLAPARLRIMPLKFLDANGNGSTSDAIRAIYYAVNQGARILNNSWGGGAYSTALHEAITYAYQHQSLFLAAAGNTAGNNDESPMYPASYSVPNVMSVAATNNWDYLASFSNFGAHSVHVGSPGVSILSTYPGNKYGYSSGTSMATPLVAGIAALVAAEADRITGYQIKNVILDGGNQVGSLVGKVASGERVNVLGAVLKAKTTSNVPSQPSYDIRSDANARELASMSGETAGGCGVVHKLLLDGASRTGTGAGGNLPFSAIAFLVGLMLPLITIFFMKRQVRDRGANRRRHERYLIDSQVRVRVGEREIFGQVSCISVGGARLDVSEMLGHGGSVRMLITGPDGVEQIEVDGRVVWNENNRSYGVEFKDTTSSVVDSITSWTRNLVKAR